MINFFSENINFTLKNKVKLRNWICDVIHQFGKKCGTINFIFCNDDYLLQINKKFLNRDYLTDVIAFPYGDENKIEGDVFISVDRVGENAKKYNVSFDDELHRVMIHAILHYLGFDDKTEQQKKIMRQKEDFYLEKLKTLLK